MKKTFKSSKACKSQKRHRRSPPRSRPLTLDEKISSYFGFVTKAKLLLLRSYPCLCDKTLSSADTHYQGVLERVWRTRGLADMLAYSKRVRLYVTRHLSGEPLISKDPKVKLSRDHLPVALGQGLLRIVRRGTTAEKRWLLTVLYSTRCLKLPVSPKVEDISDPSPSQTKLASTTSEALRYRRGFWRSLGLWQKPSEVKFSWSQFHMSTKSGPNGHALWHWWLDWLALPSSLKELISSFGGPPAEQHGDSLGKIMDLYEKTSSYMSDVWMQIFTPKTSKNKPRRGKIEVFFRAITAIPDKEGKTRVIAIGDYFSQTVLKPFHNSLFKVLRRISQDCTFDQGSFRSKMDDYRDRNLIKGSYHSIDLTAATDRFPIEFICAVLCGYYPKDTIAQWREIMVGYPFTWKGSGMPQGDIKYSVGNPMGFYSSWNSFAVAHHFVVYMACCRLGIRWKDAPYVLLGDDIVIAHDDIAREYKAIIHDLGVECSTWKTHVSEHTYEFAKRWIHHDQEISPFSLAGLFEVRQRYNLFVNFLLQLESKSWNPTKGIVDVIDSWYVLDRKPGRFRRKIREKAMVCKVAIEAMQGVISGDEAINTLYQLRHNTPLPYPLEEGEGSTILHRAAKECFMHSNDPPDGEKRNLGLFAQQLVMLLTSERFEPLMFEGFFPFHVPALNVYGQIEETWVKLQKLTGELASKEVVDWPLYLRSLTIPVSDKKFLVRQKQVMPQAAAVVSKRIYDSIEVYLQSRRHSIQRDRKSVV